METKDVIILVACIAAVGFNLYRKYVAKNKPGSRTGTGFSGKSVTGSNDDDYEPYSGK